MGSKSLELARGCKTEGTNRFRRGLGTFSRKGPINVFPNIIDTTAVEAGGKGLQEMPGLMPPLNSNTTGSKWTCGLTPEGISICKAVKESPETGRS